MDIIKIDYENVNVYANENVNRNDHEQEIKMQMETYVNQNGIENKSGN